MDMKKIRLLNAQKHFSLMDVILMYSGYQHASATHVAIFRVVRTRIQIYVTKIYLITPGFRHILIIPAQLLVET
jgi:hypothetical protein